MHSMLILIHRRSDFMRKFINATGMFGVALVLVGSNQIDAAPISLVNTYSLPNTLADPSSNFHPQGLGYDSSAGELLFMQQSSNTIYRTDLTGNLLGSRTIGPIIFRSDGATASTANFTVSVAADGIQYYFSDYTNNSTGYDLYSVGKTSGPASAISTETAGYGGYPIDVRNGLLYRTNFSTTYNYGNLNQIRTAAVGSPDTILSTVTLAGAVGIGDIAVDPLSNTVWTLDYLANASIRQYDLTTGNLIETHNVGLDGLTAGLTLDGSGNLYHYDWKSGSGSTLSVFSHASSPVPEPTSMALFGLTALGMGVMRRRRKQTAEEVA